MKLDFQFYSQWKFDEPNFSFLLINAILDKEDDEFIFTIGILGLGFALTFNW